MEREIKHIMNKLDFDYETSKSLVVIYIEQALDIFEEIEQLLKANNHEAITERCHKLKGASATLRFADLELGFINAELHMKQNHIETAMAYIEEIKLYPIFKYDISQV